MRATPKTLLPKSEFVQGLRCWEKTCRLLLSNPNATLHIRSFEILDPSSPAFLVGAVASRIEKVEFQTP